MRHRLGSYRPRPGSSDFEHLLGDEHMGGPMTRALEEMLQVRLSMPVPTPLAQPDLLAALEPTHPDRAWVDEIHDRLSRMERRGREFRLLACEYVPGPGGFLTLAASTPRPAFEVAPGDGFQIGFAAMRSGDARVRLWPRLLREVCTNGSLVAVGEFQHHDGAEGIGEAAERCFVAAQYEPVLRALEEARKTTVRSARETMDEFQRIAHRPELFRRYLARFQEQFEEAKDDSLYGLMNAVTATAREVDDWDERLDLEEFAGALARLRRPVPSRSGGRTLVSV